MNNIDTSLIGTYIKNVRLSKGWSQAKLEYISGISASSISNIEHGNKGIFYNMSIPGVLQLNNINFFETLDIALFFLSIFLYFLFVLFGTL